MTIHGMHVINPELGPCTAPVEHFRIWDSHCTWKHIHKAPGVYDWTRLDYVVKNAQENGATNLTYVLGATPEWLARNPSLEHYAPWIGPGSNSAPYSMDEWVNFVREVVLRYRGEIGSFQVWNEPQLKDFWGYNSWTALAHMTELAYETVHKFNPSAKVISGAVIPRKSSGGMRRGGRYLKALRAKGWPVDIYSAHIYPEIDKTPGTWRLFVKRWENKLVRLGAPPKPRWVTETNMNLKGGPLSDEEISAYMRRINKICEEENIYKCYWYAWQHTDSHLLGIPFSPGSQGTSTLTQIIQESS